MITLESTSWPFRVDLLKQTSSMFQIPLHFPLSVPPPPFSEGVNREGVLLAFELASQKLLFSHAKL